MTTTYTFDQLKADVRKEAEALRVHATKEELGRLDITSFDPSHYDSCIYGQMTYTCFSTRAAFLIFNCCKRYFKSEDEDMTTMEEYAKAGRVLEVVNGEKIDGVTDAEGLSWHRSNRSHVFHFSAIEAYIMLPEAKNENLIAFLRGETETLEL